MPVAIPLNASQRRILVVEDNQDIRESTCELLSMSGFELCSASTGLEALESALGFAPTAVLLNVARRLRAKPQFASTLLIAMTGYDTPEAHAQSAAAGFEHHIPKPVNFDELTVLLS